VRLVGRPRQQRSGCLVVNADRGPAAAFPPRRSLVIQGLDLGQPCLPVGRRLPDIMNQTAIASRRAGLKRFREQLRQSGRATQMINKQMA
jgi:hypothetical protein